MHWPQWTYIALSAGGLMVNCYLAGKNKDISDIVTTVIATSAVYFLLYMGGFFNGGCI